MAELVLSTVGQALGARLPGVLGTIGAALGRAGGAMLGRGVDERLFGASRTFEGGRLTDLHLQGSTEGASIPAIFGSVRIAGQVIWAARFKERVQTEEIDTGGKGGGPSTKTRTYTYSLSFAVGLCEGEITRIGRVWANGEPFDLSQVGWRLHTGAEDQATDPLIEAIEGGDRAPAYRGLAYIVFEDLPLERFGNTIPQLSFEIIRAVREAGAGPSFQERVKGVCLIPGAGEFVYATEAVLRRAGPGQEIAENVHAEQARANLRVSLDQLKADFPNCESVLLVVSWFGADLRCGVCEIKPGVEIADKATTPTVWSAGGVTRGSAHVVSRHNGAPAYGGTPSDASVLQAIAELKARGYKVGLYPFILMDVPAANTLADPYGGVRQAAYPWRGRISVHPAAGQPGSADKTAAAATQVSAFFGAAAPAHFSVSGGAPTYSGPAEWSFRRHLLHYAKLAQLAGGVDYFVLGSELRGLTTARDSATSFPAVAALKTLAADVRAMVGASTKLTYAADWSEYAGHQPQDGSGDVFFHLDPLWSDVNIDVVGIDWYPPLTDWREGATHFDAQLSASIHNLDYLKGRIEAGENYDWFYASDAARALQARTAITDGAYNEPWLYRAKDVRNFWARSHYNRPGGVRATAPTAWTPQSKPIWFIELGCPAVDKGANAPNLFIDAKSAESKLPPSSTGVRDDLIQRRTIEAYLTHWDAASAANPVSSVNGKRMIEKAFVWCWDARPYPGFPARADIWADAPSWRLGHWLNGRAGLSGLGAVVAELCRRSGVDQVDVSQLTGAVSGYVADAPTSARALLEPLMLAYDFAAREHDGALAFFHRGVAPAIQMPSALFTEEGSLSLFAERNDSVDAPSEARVRFLDASRDYRVATASARRLDRATEDVVSFDAPLVLEAEAAEILAKRALIDQRARLEAIAIDLAPTQLWLEPGDRLALAGSGDDFEVERVEAAETARIRMRRMRPAASLALSLAEPSAPSIPNLSPTPAVSIIDIAGLPGAEDDDRPLVAVFASPWLGSHGVYAALNGARRATIDQPAIMGELLWALWPGPVDRWDEGNRVRIKLYGGALASASADAVLNGANAFAIESGSEWEVVQARACVLVAPNEYELSGFLRGVLGSAHAMRSPHPVGARIVKLDERLGRLNVSAHEWLEPLPLIAPPANGGPSDPRAAQISVTLPRASRRLWAPAHLRGTRWASGDIVLSWVRCTGQGGDAWGPGEPPLGAATESYFLEILDGAIVKRAISVAAPAYTYSVANQVADFGAPPASLRFRVAQVGDSGATGLNSALTIPL